MPPMRTRPEVLAHHPGGRIGLIADTHGLLRPEASAFLAGSNLIIHGGDIGPADVLERLRRIAPLVAVQGNNDRNLAQHLPESQLIQVGDVRVYVIHDSSHIQVDLAALGVRVVVSGHSHQPSSIERDGILFLNPGSAGPRRFKLPVAVGELCIEGSALSARIQYL